MSAGSAPYGTQDTPLTRVRIIGGKPIRVPEEADLGRYNMISVVGLGSQFRSL